MPISETILGNLIKSVIDGFTRLIIDGRADKLRIDHSGVANALFENLAAIDNWSSSISMLGLRRDKKLAEVFVELSLNIGFLRHENAAANNHDVEGYERAYHQPAFEKPVTVIDLFDSDEHVAILGGPGAGKTTSLQRIAQLALRGREQGECRVPILVVLRDFQGEESLVTHLLAKLGILVRIGDAFSDQVRRIWEQRALHRYLDRVSALLLVDGLDEVHPTLRFRIENELRELALAQGAHRLILTCRTVEYKVSLKRVQPYTITPLTELQILSFATQWLGREEGLGFLAEIRSSHYSGTEAVPLRLAHLCAIYERNGALPDRPIEVYDAIVSLLVEHWDEERGVRRVSGFSDFPPQKKRLFMESLAFELAVSGRKGAFFHDDLEAVYQKIAHTFNLPSGAVNAVLLELESHTGLIMRAGYRRYEFVHLVIQEFLCAVHASRTDFGMVTLIPHFPNEAALVVAYSGSVNEYLKNIFPMIESLKEESLDFVLTFLQRLDSENVNVVPSAEVGWVLLAYAALISSLMSRYTRLLEVRKFSDSFSFFVRVGVAQSIDKALTGACIQKNQLGSVRIINEINSGISLGGADNELRIQSGSGLTRLIPAKYLNEACSVSF